MVQISVRGLHMHILPNLHSIDKAHDGTPTAQAKNSMEGAGSIRSKTMVVRQMGHMECMPCDGRGLDMLENVINQLDCTLKMS